MEGDNLSAPVGSSDAFKAGYKWYLAKVRTSKGSFLSTPGALAYLKKLGLEGTKDMSGAYASEAVRERISRAKQIYSDFLDGTNQAHEDRIAAQRGKKGNSS